MATEKKTTMTPKSRLRFLDYEAMIDRKLIHNLVKKKSELFAYSFQIKTGTLKQTHFIKILKKEVAWIFTILRQRKVNIHETFGALTNDYVQKITADSDAKIAAASAEQTIVEPPQQQPKNSVETKSDSENQLKKNINVQSIKKTQELQGSEQVVKKPKAKIVKKNT